jgi:hypothetical protein
LKGINKDSDNGRWKDGSSETYLHSLYSTEGKTCERCGSDSDIVRHHEDEDRTNNESDNIHFLCRGCHTSHHRKGKPKNFSPEGLSAIREANNGNEYWLDKKHSEESKAKMSDSQIAAAPFRKRDEFGRWTKSV